MDVYTCHLLENDKKAGKEVVEVVRVFLKGMEFRKFRQDIDCRRSPHDLLFVEMVKTQGETYVCSLNRNYSTFCRKRHIPYTSWNEM